jgi:hypothetical protein
MKDKGKILESRFEPFTDVDNRLENNYTAAAGQDGQ